MTQKLKLSRQQLAGFLKDHESIKQFEKLFDTVDTLPSTGQSDDTALSAADAVAEVNLALELLHAVIRELKPVTDGPVIDEGNLVHRYAPEKIPGDKTFTGLVVADEIRFAPGITPANTLGTTYWDDNSQTIATILDPTNGVTLQHGQEILIRIVNKTGIQINDGQVVYVNGAQGNRPTAALARADLVTTSMVIGVATQNIANNAEGFITTLGLVHGFNTSTYAAGDKLYLSATIAGGLTNVVPVSPNYGTWVAHVMNSTNNGTIFVHPEIPLALDVDLTVGTNLAAPSQAAVKNYIAGVNSNLVHRTGTETVGGVKTFSNVIYYNDLIVMSKTQGKGIQVDTATPTWGWRDMRGSIDVRTGGGAVPTRAAYQGALYAVSFDSVALVQECFTEYHFDHDYVMGTDCYVHAHWSTIITATGNVDWLFDLSYGKGYNQGRFEGTVGSKLPVTVGITQAGGTDFYHQIAEVVFSAPGGLINGTATNYSITAGAAVLTSAAAAFTADMIGKTIRVVGAGVAGANLDTTISAFTSTTSVTLAANASTTLVAVANAFKFRVLDANLFEPDGIILCRTWRQATRASDTLTQIPFLHYVDCHYQSTNLGTKQKNGPAFWT